MSCCCGLIGIRGFLFIIVLLSAAHFVIDRKENSVFSAKAMHEIGIEGRRRGLLEWEKASTATPGLNNRSLYLINAVVEEAHRRFPKYILKDGPWMFNNAGGAMGSMKVLHASFHEYVIIFGTAIGSEGHTGRFLTDDYFTIIEGEQWCQAHDNPVREVYRPGDQNYMPRYVAKHYKMPDELWALEYAEGDIISMLPFGIADTIFSTLDFVTWFQTAKVSFEQMVYFAMMGKI